MQALMRADSPVAGHHSEQMVKYPRQALVQALVRSWRAQRLEEVQQGGGIVAFCEQGGHAREAIGRAAKMLQAKAQGGQAWQTRRHPLWVSRPQLQRGRKQHLLRFQCAVMQTGPQALIEHPLMGGVLVDQKDTARVLQDDIGVVELSEWDPFQNRPTGFWITGIQVQLCGEPCGRLPETRLLRGP